MQEMDRRLGLLRLLLADLADRERQAAAAVAQHRAQLTRIVDFTVQRNGSVANALAAMADVEERLAQQEMIQRHLALLRQRARAELEALIVTRDVSDARARLDELQARRTTLTSAASDVLDATGVAGVAGELQAIDAEIAELRASIQAASEAAARSLTDGRTATPQPGEIPPRG